MQEKIDHIWRERITSKIKNLICKLQRHTNNRRLLFELSNNESNHIFNILDICQNCHIIINEFYDEPFDCDWARDKAIEDKNIIESYKKSCT